MTRSQGWVLTINGIFLGLALGARADVVTQPKRFFGLGDLGPVAVSPDGRHFASAGASGAFLWSLETGIVRFRLDEQRVLISAVAFSPDGRTLTTGGRDGSIWSWEVESGKPLHTFSGHRSDITSLSFATDGRKFVSASADNTARVWLLETGERLHQVTVPGTFINAAIFTTDGSGLVTADGSMTNNVRLWDLTSETIVRSFGEHIGQVFGLALLPDGQLATAGDDRQVRIWNLQTGDRVHLLTGATDVISELATLPGTTNLIAGCHDGRVITWDVGQERVLHNFVGERLSSLGIVPDTHQVLIAHTDFLLRLWNLTNGTVQQVFEGHSTSTGTGVAFSPDGRYVLSGGTEKATRLWNRTNAQPVRKFEGHGAGTSVAAFSPDGAQVLTTIGFPRKAAQLWNTETGELERELIGHTDWLMAAVFSPDGMRIATGAYDRTVRIWSREAGTLLRTLTGSSDAILSVAFSPDGTRVAGGGGSFDPAARIWNIQTGEILHTFSMNAGAVNAVAFSPAGEELVVTWDDGLIRVFDSATGKMKAEMIAGGFINDAVFSSDGDWLLVGEGWPSFVARLWDWRNSRELRIFAGHTAPVGSVAFNTNGTQILTAADTVRLWDNYDLAAQLQTARKPGALELRWKAGSLQYAPSIQGPWHGATNATSPWTIPTDAPASFYRVAVPTEE